MGASYLDGVEEWIKFRQGERVKSAPVERKCDGCGKVGRNRESITNGDTGDILWLCPECG